jgi:hypothetical protein
MAVNVGIESSVDNTQNWNGIWEKTGEVNSTEAYIKNDRTFRWTLNGCYTSLIKVGWLIPNNQISTIGFTFWRGLLTTPMGVVLWSIPPWGALGFTCHISKYGKMQIQSYSLFKTSLRVRHNLSSQLYGTKVPVFSEISGVEKLVPIVCWK